MDIAPFMRRGLTLFSLLIFTWSTQHLCGEDVSFQPLLRTSSVLRPKQVRTSVSKPSSNFRLVTAGPSRGHVVTLVQYEPQVGEYADSDESNSGVFSINTLPESIPDEELENRASEPVPRKRAVPLDGVLREEVPTDDEDDIEKLASTRTSFGWIAGTNDQLGMVEFESQPLSQAVFNTEHQPVAVGSSFGARWLSGPDITDLPPQLFNILINVGTAFQYNDRVTVDAMISPGWFTDFSNKGVEAFRLPWHLISYFQTDSDWQWVLGVTDLARDDIRYLPVVGMVYSSPESIVRLDLVFPKPRVAMKVSQTPQETQWLYLAGELGGGSWAISRADRAYDVVTYRDYRLMCGLESKGARGHAVRIEGGWVFSRSIEYRSDVGNYNPPDSAMVRISADY